MTKFNPEGRDVLTIGEALRPAMQITDEADAAQYLADYTAYIQRAIETQRAYEEKPHGDGLSAEQIARTNIGYFAGYYDRETRERVGRLFACEHPVFGKAAVSVPTPEQAFEAGLLRGMQRA